MAARYELEEMGGRDKTQPEPVADRRNQNQLKKNLNTSIFIHFLTLRVFNDWSHSIWFRSTRPRPIKWKRKLSIRLEFYKWAMCNIIVFRTPHHDQSRVYNTSNSIKNFGWNMRVKSLHSRFNVNIDYEIRELEGCYCWHKWHQ